MSEQSATETPIRTGDGQPAPDYHPDVANRWFADIEHPLAAKSLAAVKDCLKVSYDVSSAIDDTERALKATAHPDAPVYRGANGALVREHGGEAELAKAAEKATERALQTIGRRVAEVESHRTVLATAIEQSMRYERGGTPFGIAVAQEIRAHVKALPEAERTAFVQNAITSGDVQTIDALLDHVPPYLSGMTAANAEMFRNHAAKALAPAESKLLESVDKALERMRAGASSLMKRTAQVTAVANDRAARRAEALAKLTGAK